MPPQNRLRLLLLLLLVMRIVLASVCSRLGSWGLVIKLNFLSDFEHKVWSRFCSWSSGKIWSWSLVSFFFCWCFVDVMLNPNWILVDILKLGLVKILKLKCYREADVWLRFWSWCLVEILKMKFDQDLCLNLWYELNPRVRCAFGNVFINVQSQRIWSSLVHSKVGDYWFWWLEGIDLLTETRRRVASTVL